MTEGQSELGSEAEGIRFVSHRNNDVINNILLRCYEDKFKPFKWPDSRRRRDGIHWLRVSFFFDRTCLLTGLSEGMEREPSHGTTGSKLLRTKQKCPEEKHRVGLQLDQLR